LTLKAVLVQVFKKADDDNRLLTSKRLPFILFRWKEWGVAEEVEAFIHKCLGSKKALTMLLVAFVSEVISSSDNYNVLNKKTIGELYDIIDIEKR
jgi:hypothetical protein